MKTKQIMPEVALILACDHVARNSDGKYVIRNPWHTVALPSGATFPFDVLEFWIYLQLAGGVGVFKFAVEMHHLLDDEDPLRVARSPFSDDIECTGGFQAIDLAVRFCNLPFETAGLYEFRALAGYNELNGARSLIRVLPSMELGA
jgi:hypothetical protein